MLSDLQAIQFILNSAKCPEDIFGEKASEATIKREYHRLARVAHPDRYLDPKEAGIAQVVLARINNWHAQATAKLEAGTYGDWKPHVTPPAKTDFVPTTVNVKGRTYIVTSELGHGDLADVYRAKYTDGGAEHQVALKLARNAADNDLLQAEAQTLAKLYPKKQKSEKYYRHLPKLTDSFKLKGKGGLRQANILELADGCVSLADIIQAYPKGVDFRDAAWMFKRCLSGLGFVHQAGIIHGAILPPHILVHPVNHGATIVDWCYAVPSGKPIRALSKPYKAIYAPEVLTKGAAVPQTDIYMLAKTFMVLLGASNPPVRIIRFLESCMFKVPGMRPSSAWDLHDEFDDLLTKLVGPKKYRLFTMPQPI